MADSSQFKKRTYDTCVEKIYICVDICVCAYIHIFCINSYCICFVIRSIRNMESTCSVDRDDERIYNKMQYGGIYVSALFNCIVCTCNVRKYNFGIIYCYKKQKCCTYRQCNICGSRVSAL